MDVLLEPDLLQTFVAIADSGSFNQAAKRIYRTQSAVSMQMKRLEEVIGHSLFGRQGRSMNLTADGELLLGHARRILRAHQQALAAFDEASLESNIVLGMPDAYSSTFLPGILVRFAEAHSRVHHVKVVCDTTLNLLPRLAEGSVDLALITGGCGDGSGVVVRREPLVWVTSARHCAHKQELLPLAMYQSGCLFRTRALEALSMQGRASRIVYSSTSMAGIEAALRTGLAVGVLGRSTVPKGLRVLTERDGFPSLPDYSITLCRTPGKESPLLDELEQHITRDLKRWR